MIKVEVENILPTEFEAFLDVYSGESELTVGKYLLYMIFGRFYRIASLSIWLLIIGLVWSVL